jgi:hypothetical protein
MGSTLSKKKRSEQMQIMRLILGMLLVFLWIDVAAQTQTTPTVSRRLDDLATMNPQRSIPGVGFDERVSSLQGSEYLNPKWLMGGIRFPGDTAYTESLPLKYNYLDEVLEIKDKATIKLAYAANLDCFFVHEDGKNRYFISGRLLKEEQGDPLTGFYEVLQQGHYLYLRHTTASIKKPSYKEAFHVGSLDYQILKNSKEFIAENGVIYPLKTFIRKQKKSNPALKDFINTYSLSIKEEKDVARIVRFMNRGY